MKRESSRHRLAFIAAFAICAGTSVNLTFAAKPSGKSLIPFDVTALKFFGTPNPADAVQKVPVVGQDFRDSLVVNTIDLNIPLGTDSGLSASLNTPIKKGDVLWISFKARCLESRRESGEAAFELRFDQLVNGNYKWPSYLASGVSFGHELTEVSIPFLVPRDIEAGGMGLIMSFDAYPQKFEIGPVTFINCGPNVEVTDLPRSKVIYGGSEPGAPWRKEAADRIEKLRKGSLAIKVLDKAGKPVANAVVDIRMTRLAFNIGTAVDSRNILDAGIPTTEAYRDHLIRYFNQVVFDNEMKWPTWAAKGHNPDRTLRALDWLLANGITARGHVMVWPSWKKLPRFMSSLKNDKQALRREVIKHIERQTSKMKGRFEQWDVTNELYAHHDLINTLGREELAEWYRAAHSGAPDTQLFYNEYTMFHPDGPGPEHFYETVRFLKEVGAPIQGIGEQAHIAGSPPSIPLVLARLERFGKLGLPITITEFDIASNDEDFQASYMRDFMIAVFSNPNTVGFVQWGFWEGQHWFPSAAMWNRDWSIRKHGQVFVDMVTKSWRTDANGRSSTDGSFATTAFYGDYDLTITYGGKNKVMRIQHRAGSSPQNVSLD